jgi:hypothetical protein
MQRHVFHVWWDTLAHEHTTINNIHHPISAGIISSSIYIIIVISSGIIIISSIIISSISISISSIIITNTIDP